jgi:outer membrane lipoprotein-sorting protein
MKKTLLLFGCLLLFLTAGAQPNLNPIHEPDLTIIKDIIKAKNAEIQTLICPFIQTKKMAVLMEDAVTKGIMYFEKPNKFRWEYTGNNPFVFVQNGRKFFTRINEKVTEVKDNSTRLFQEISNIVIASISGEILENSKKFKTEFQENNGMVVVSLTPMSKAMQNFISTIKLYLIKTTYLASKIEIYENGGDVTVIQYENVTVNHTINDEIFILR